MSAVDRYAVRWKFPDGTTADVPLADVQRQIMEQAAHMLGSPDPEIREAGRKRLDELSRQSAAAVAAQAQRPKAAKAPRPGARSPLRERIIEVMRSHKRGGTEFKTFMQAWQSDHIDGLRLTPSGERSYMVKDENADGNACKVYGFDTLRNKLWSKA